jgi:hypothetical protein
VKTYLHEVEVRLESPESIGTSVLQVSLTASQEVLSAQLLNSFSERVLNYRIEHVSSLDSNDQVRISERLIISSGIDRLKAEQILNVSVNSLALGHEAIRFRVENASELASLMSIQIRLVRNPKLWASTTLFYGIKNSLELGLVGRGGAIEVLIPLSRLGVESIGDKRHDLSVSISLNLGTVLNVRDFEHLISRKAEQVQNKIYASF